MSRADILKRAIDVLHVEANNRYERADLATFRAEPNTARLHKLAAAECQRSAEELQTLL